MNQNSLRHRPAVSLMGCLTIAVLLLGPSQQALAEDVVDVPSPTGVPEVDWQNIQDALDSLPPGGIAHLAAGTYRIHRPLAFLNFSGTLRGAGADRSLTTIEVSTASNGDLFAVIHEPEFDNLYFPGSQLWGTPIFSVNNAFGEFNVEDLTVKAISTGLAEMSYILDSNTGDIAWFDEVIGNNNTNLIRGPLGPECNVTIDNCSFLGAGEGGFVGPPGHGIQLSGNASATVGDFTVRDSEFVGIGSNVVSPIALNDGTITIENNTFSDCPRPVVLWNNNGCTINVLNNETHNVLHASVMVWNISGLPKPQTPCHVTVSGLETHDGAGVYWDQFWTDTQYTGVLTHNTIRQKSASDWAGFELWDGGNSQLTISHNSIHGEGAFIWGPIFTFDVHDAVVRNNIITGSGPAAMYIGVDFFFGTDVSGITFLGNNVQNWTTDGGPFEPEWEGVAPIWLGSASRTCTVVGGSNKTNVVDEGEDNVLVGVNNMGYTDLGQDIRDAMTQRIEARRAAMDSDSSFP